MKKTTIDQSNPAGGQGKHPTRKERERLARRQEILEVAQEVFAEKGFTRTTLDEIAERAEYGKGTLYNYFDSKESLFSAAMQNLFNDVCAIARTASDQDATLRENFISYTRRIFGFYRDNEAFCRLVMRERFGPQAEDSHRRFRETQERVRQLAEPLAHLLEDAMRRKEVRRGDPVVLASMFVGLVHHYIMHIVSQDSSGAQIDINAQAEMIVSVFFDGITEPGAKGAV